VQYFEKSSSKSAEALNALGVIYQSAPDPFEKDATITRPYGKIRRDAKKSKKYFDQASELGNLNSRYNLGQLHLDENSSSFSFSKAYDHFKFAAGKGHTLSSYDAGVMNYLGIGTYKSC